MKCTKQLKPRQVEAVAGLLKLAGEPGRLNILIALDEGVELRSGELAAALGIIPTQISMRLMLLRSSGLVFDRKVGKTKRYSLTEKGQLMLEAFRSLFLLV